MKSQTSKGVLHWLVAVTVMVLLCPTVGANEIQKLKQKVHPKIESVLTELQEEYEKGPDAGEEFAKQRLLKVKDKERITVYIVSEIGKTAEDIDKDKLKSHGVELIKSVGNTMKATVPVKMIRKIADDVDGISFIRTPDRPSSETITSEGVALTGVTSYHNAGFTGAGVSVAIIDSEFGDACSAVDAGEIPGNTYLFDCTGPTCYTVECPWFAPWEGNHGTAVAEIIHDVAPAAQLYLLRTDDHLDVITAYSQIGTAGVKIVNNSQGFFNQNFGGGECYDNNPVCIADAAYSLGILWVKSAGNQGQGHYSATFTDANSNGWHDISPGDELISFNVSAGQQILLYLTWDAWPVTNQDYDLYLLDSALNTITASETPQTGTQKPTEKIEILTAPYTGNYYVGIRKYAATSNHKIKLFGKFLTFDSYVSSNSLTCPADAAGAFAVGAIDLSESTWSSSGQIASYSSQGPTNDGRTKPEIVGPAYVSTHVRNGFDGTSAAAPHVAGAAALILEKNPTYTVQQLGNALIASAIDMGSPGQDNVFGFGRLNLPTLPVAVTVTTLPAGLQITVDGALYTAPQTFNWTLGSTHTLSISSPQDGAGTRYLFTSWSDGGTQAHVVTTPAAATTYTASFVESIPGLVYSYYQNVLDRVPDQGGWNFWTSEIERVLGLGIDVREGFQALSKLFFNADEYILRNKSDTEFVTDLYQTFLNRQPDDPGLAHWVGQLQQGLTRDMLIIQFANCEEFKLYLQGILGTMTTRPENNLVNDLYRGFLNRLPDSGGFNHWLMNNPSMNMRSAQCSGAAAVRSLTYQIALSFIQSNEYTNRHRTNSQYVEDLYNGILKRGADPAGYMHWINLLNNGTYNRVQMLSQFTNSPEFQTRVQQVIDAGDNTGCDTIDIVAFQSSRNGTWFSVNSSTLPTAQSNPDVQFDIKDSVINNRKNGQISPSLLSGYFFIQWNISSSQFEKYADTVKGVFIRSATMSFVDYPDNRVLQNWDHKSVYIPSDIQGIIRLCNENNIPVFLEINYSDYIPGLIGTGVESLQYADNITRTITFLNSLQNAGIHLDGITFGDEIEDEAGYGTYKPTTWNSDLIGRFISYARAIKSNFPMLKIYAFDTYIFATQGRISIYWDFFQRIRQAELTDSKPLLDGFMFRESYTYIDGNNNLLASQSILDDTESLYRDTPVYRYDVDGTSHSNPDAAYLPLIVTKTNEIFGRSINIGITEYLPAGPIQISETDTSRYSDIDFIIHFSDIVGIYAQLGLDIVSKIMFGDSVNMHKSYFDRNGNLGPNYPVHEQLAQYFAGEILNVDRSVDYDTLRVKIYATRRDTKYFIMILNKDVNNEITARITFTNGLDLTIRLPRRSYTSLRIDGSNIIVSGIGN